MAYRYNHGIDIGWISVGITIGMALPVIGDLIDGTQIKEVNLNTLLFCVPAWQSGMWVQRLV